MPREVKSSALPVAPPEGFVSWIHFAVESMSLGGCQSLDNPDASPSVDLREAIHSEYARLLRIAEAARTLVDAWQVRAKTLNDPELNALASALRG